MYFLRLIRLLFLFLISLPFVSNAQLTVVPSQPAAVLAAKLAGNGISISAPVLTCAAVANGTFRSVTTPIVIDSGIVLTSGRAVNTAGAESFLASTNNGTTGDLALTTLAGTTTYDACTLEFDFIPRGDTVSFNYQFGSEEYINSTCGQYNDAFAFFISGPGITGSQNMALVPGTNIPVTVNTINSGVPGPAGWPGFCNIANCTSMGPGSPFTTYFVNNTGGTTVTYKGYTTKLKAFHDVTPCSTYHLKMTIADGANGLYDSGVFIEAGSLKTNSYYFKKSDSIGHTIAGIPNALVKGCAPAPITVLNSRVTGTPQKVYFSYGGTAIRGTDYTAPDSASIVPGDTSVVMTVSGTAGAPTGPRTIIIYLSSPFSCGIVDTVSLNLLDAPVANILTPDTSICYGASFQIRVAGSAGLVYNWTPATALSSATAMQPIASPTVNTSYTVISTLPLSGCAPILRTINVTVNLADLTILTPDTTICIGSSIKIRTTGSAGLTYSWTPSATLSNATNASPIASPITTTTYSVAATSTIGGCPAFAQVKITVADPQITITTPNTAICPGNSLKINVAGDPTYTYSWLTTYGLDDATLMEPTATPTGTTTYTVTASVPGLGCTTTAQITISILPAVLADAGSGKSVCVRQSIELLATPSGNNYSYSWAGPDGFISGLQSPFIKSATPASEGIYTVTVTDLLTGCSGNDTTIVKVGNDSMSIKNVTPDQTIKSGSSIRLNAANAVLYTWTPNDGSLDNPNINNPVATPTETTRYTVYAVGRNGCLDTAGVTITVVTDNSVFIPSAFTPNGDGLNDYFRVMHNSTIKIVEIHIFNRWGELIYSSEANDTKGWDGTWKGLPADMGTYNYSILTGLPDGTNELHKGSVELIR
jgi:gliding motility-associated-like protein